MENRNSIVLTTLDQIAKFEGKTNQIIGVPDVCEGSSILFNAKNCVLKIAAGVKLLGARIEFSADNATVEIGADSEIKSLIRCGQHSSVTIGARLNCTGGGVFTAAEGAHLTVGDDCLFGRGFAARDDDAHPIFDRRSGKRINKSQDTAISNHVWLAPGVRLQPGAVIEEGCVIGVNSLVTAHIPANCVAVGTPARVSTRNIVWDKTHLANDAPWKFDTTDTLETLWSSDLPFDE